MLNSRRLRVCLVFPRFKYISGDPPLGIAYIAAYLKEKLPDVDVSIIDTTFDRSLEIVRKSLEDINPDIVGIYLDTIMYTDGIRIARMARENGAFVVAGGPHVTMAPESVINYVDMAILGEGEKTFTRIIETFPDIEIESLKGIVCKRNGQRFENKELNLIEDINTIPIPDRDLLDMDRYIREWDYLDSVKMMAKGTTMIASRGCQYNPVIEGILGKELRMRSPENVVQEMSHIKERYKIEGIFFHDESFAVNRDWVREFCDLVEAQGIRMLWGCNTRADTIDEELLKRMSEVGLRNIHLYIESDGKDRAVHDDIRRVVDIANRLHISVLGFFEAYPSNQPNTLQKRALFSFYTHPLRWGYIARHIISPNGIKRLFRKVACFPSEKML